MIRYSQLPDWLEVNKKRHYALVAYITATMRVRYNIKTELLLMVLPTIAVLLMAAAIRQISGRDILFTSLASSAFLIYADPLHEVNSTRTLVIAQVAAAVIGYLSHLVAGTGYIAMALAMAVTILTMVISKALHPPAVSTTLVFALHSPENSFKLFVIAILILVLLVAVQQLSALVLKWHQKRDSSFKK